MARGREGAGKIVRKPKKKLSWARRRTKNKRRMMAALDAECRKNVFERDNNTCQMAEVPLKRGKCEGPLQWSHIQGRGNNSLRWDENNSMVMCSAHHVFWHMQPAQSLLWFAAKYPERAEHIRRTIISNEKFGLGLITALYEAITDRR
jgi:hypothetical protein